MIELKNGNCGNYGLNGNCGNYGLKRNLWMNWFGVKIYKLDLKERFELNYVEMYTHLYLLVLLTDM
jgi:hypothetical protein